MDKTGISRSIQLRASGLDSGNGNAANQKQHWQLALEKAYLQGKKIAGRTENAELKQPPAGNNENANSPADKANISKDNYKDGSVSRKNGVSISNAGGNTPFTRSAPGALESSATNSALNRENSAVLGQKNGPESVLKQKIIAAVEKSFSRASLPAGGIGEQSVIITVAPEGVRVVLRDYKMDGDQIKKLISHLHKIFKEMGLDLLSVTVNGEEQLQTGASSSSDTVDRVAAPESNTLKVNTSY